MHRYWHINCFALPVMHKSVLLSYFQGGEAFDVHERTPEKGTLWRTSNAIAPTENVRRTPPRTDANLLNVSFFFQASGFTLQVAKIEQLSATHFVLTLDFNFRYKGAAEEKDTLNTHATG